MYVRKYYIAIPLTDQMKVTVKLIIHTIGTDQLDTQHIGVLYVTVLMHSVALDTMGLLPLVNVGS